MGKPYDEITPAIAEWIAQQRLFFVATAPLAPDGLLNCSPKGMDSFRVLNPKQVAYLDLTGSGVETAAHVRENGRIVLMFCAFDGPPKILRLHGIGEVLPANTPEYDALCPLFPNLPGARAIIRVRLTRVGESCGYAVPRFDYVDQRDQLIRWAEKKTDEELADYRRKKNANSLDGLPGLDPQLGRSS